MVSLVNIYILFPLKENITCYFIKILYHFFFFFFPLILFPKYCQMGHQVKYSSFPTTGNMINM